jgi:osmotically-inducible protein OsmY
MTPRLALAIVALTASLFTLGGCAPAIVGASMGTGVLMAEDRRPAGAFTQDEIIEDKSSLKINQRYGPDTHVNVTSYNGIVLLSGEAPSEAVRGDVEAIVRREGGTSVRAVHNYLTVGPVASMGARTEDTVTTSKVKGRFVDAQKFQINYVKVVTEASTVYLMGIVKRREAEDATAIARTTSGVKRVVRLFEYVD